MKKLTVLLLMLSMAALFVISGCSDDDSPTNSSGTIQSLMIWGSIYIESGAGLLGGYIEIFDFTSSGKTIDSAYVGDNITITDFDSWYWVGDDHYWSATIGTYHDSGYVVGDTLHLTLFDEGTVAELDVILLDRYNNAPTLITEPTSPILPNTSFDLVWSSVEYADFYTVSANSNYIDSLGNYVYDRNSWATTDTTFTIPANVSSHVGTIDYYIYPQNGPAPTGKGIVPPSISTSTMRGHIWSQGESTQGNVSVVIPISSPYEGISETSLPAKPVDSREILRNIVLGR